MKSEKGNAMVEMALILPILILLLCGIIDYGRVLHAYLTIDHAGREAARFASVEPFTEEKDTNVKNRAVEKSGDLIKKEDVTVSYSPNNNRGSIAIVTIKYEINLLTPIISSFFPNGSLELSDTTKMRIE